MATRDYSDDDDFYSQNFERKGFLSVWVGLKDRSGDKNVDTLQDLCGVGYYRLSDQESCSFNYELVELNRLLAPLSYSESFSEAVIVAARKMGITTARRVVVQYDFAYDPKKVVREIADDPLFIGVFAYSDS